jgi:hypothetical protein
VAARRGAAARRSRRLLPAARSAGRPVTPQSGVTSRPAALVDYIVTERGVVEQPDAAKMLALMEG